MLQYKQIDAAMNKNSVHGIKSFDLQTKQYFQLITMFQTIIIEMLINKTDLESNVKP